VTYLQLLSGNKNLRFLWTGQVISEIGDWLNNVAVLALALQLAGPGRQGIAIAIYAIARHLPLFLFGPIAGVVVDRADRRRVMIAADLARAILALGFLAAEQYGSLSVIYAVGAAMFSVSAFFNAAKRASVPNLTRGFDELLSANSLTTSTTAATIAAGSAIGGVIATLGGRTAVFAINAATFLVSAALISRIVFPPRASMSAAAGTDSSNELRQPVGRVRQTKLGAILVRSFDDFRQGLVYVKRQPLLTLIFLVAGGWGLGNGTARALYSIFGSRLGIAAVSGRIPNASEFGIAVLFVAMGTGGVLGAALARRVGRNRSLNSRLGTSLLLDGTGLFLFSLMPNLWTAAAILIARDLNYAIWWTSQQTLLMSRTENQFAGRVFASFETVVTLAMVASMIVSGLAADRFGISRVPAVGGLLIILSGVVWVIFSRRYSADGNGPRVTV
jgi:predicted MFS family arabinose efflux permease